MWYYWLTDVQFQGPWKLSRYPVVFKAESQEDAIRLMTNFAESWPEEIMRLSKFSECSVGYETEQKARDAARKECENYQDFENHLKVKVLV